jgi:HNH endonuclease
VKASSKPFVDDGTELKSHIAQYIEESIVAPIVRLLEEWKPIPFAPSYQASSYGRLCGVRGHVMRPSYSYAGYLVCDIHKRQYRVNRVICETFHGPAPSMEHHVAHKDSNRQNNMADNLYWATVEQNAEDLKNTNRLKGENSTASVLTDVEVIKMRELYAQGHRILHIAKQYPHVCRATVSNAILRRTWTHL